jgi:PAS domain S-box-containing protein
MSQINDIEDAIASTDRMSEFINQGPAQLLGIGMLAISVDGTILHANSKAETIFGYGQGEMRGRHFESLIPQRFRPHHKLLSQAFYGAPSRRLMGAGRDVCGLRKDGTEFPLEVGLEPLRGDDGEVYAVLAAVLNIAERKKGEAQERVLIQELAHRVNNTLSVMQAIVDKTLRTKGDDPSAFADAVVGRIKALAMAHNMLFSTEWTGTDLMTLVKRQLFALIPDAAGQRLTIEGPDVWLSPLYATQVALMVHELGTNALKHGALSNDVGVVCVAWDLRRDEGGNILSLRWVEHNGPEMMPDAPARLGFGSSLLRHGVGGGKTNWRFDPAGIVFELDLLLTDRALVPPRWPSPIKPPVT